MLKPIMFIPAILTIILVLWALPALAEVIVDTAWVRIYDGPAHGHDFGHAIAVDAHGNVYVTGVSAQNPEGDYDFDIVTIKYDTIGNQLWLSLYNGLGDGDDSPAAIIVDTSGNIYVIGESEDKETSKDFVTIKYYDDGDTAWVRRYNLPVSGWDIPIAITTDSSGNVYVTGQNQSSGPGYNYNYITVKYDSVGNKLWAKSYNGPGNEDDTPADIAVDGSENVYVTGGRRGIGTSFDYATLKYFQALRGDANRDGVISPGDLVYLINFLFREGLPPDTLELGDTNCSGYITSGDIVFLLNYLFRNGPPPDCP